ncbi:MAG: thioredoxin family protein [Rhodoferax sp.]|nr:thioredoxin family protein [Rhodoferax sp.]
MPMETLTSEQPLHARIAGPALLVLYGGVHCGVCHAIRPRIEALMAEHFADIPLAYVDCAQAPHIGAQQGVFSLPVLRFYVQGQLALEYARSFSLHEVAAQMQRVLGLSG